MSMSTENGEVGKYIQKQWKCTHLLAAKSAPPKAALRGLGVECKFAGGEGADQVSESRFKLSQNENIEGLSGQRG
jgi:hypothetical protein